MPKAPKTPKQIAAATKNILAYEEKQKQENMVLNDTQVAEIAYSRGYNNGLIVGRESARKEFYIPFNFEGWKLVTLGFTIGASLIHIIHVLSV